MVELCGEELLDRISNLGMLTEDMASQLFRQMVGAIAYCNSRGVYHKDLTPRAFMFQSGAADSPLLLIDIGLSVFTRTSTPS